MNPIDRRPSDLVPDAVPPPSLPGLPWIGSVVDFYKHPREFLIDAAARCGDVFRASTPIGSVNFVAGPAARELLQRPEESGLHRRGFFRAFEEETHVDIFGVQGDAHRRLRSLLKLTYSRQVAAQLTPELVAVTDDVLASHLPGDTVDLFELSYRIALWSAMAVVTPIDLRPWSDDFRRMGHTVMSIMVRALPPQAVHTPRYRRAKRRVEAILGEVVARHRSGEFADAPSMAMADAIVQTVTPEGDRADDLAARGALTYAIAGTEIYIGRAIGFMLYEILRNPDLYEHVQREVDAAFADGGFDASQLRRMPYLRGTYLETLRFYPLLPGLPFFAERAIDVGNHRIGAGELVMLCPHLSQFSPTFYRNPHSFDAARCMAPRNEHLQSGAHAAFGAGERTCLAVGMVEVLTLTAVSAVLRRAEFALERPTQTLDLAMRPLIAPKTPVRALVRALRDPAQAEVDPTSLSETDDLVSVVEELRGGAIQRIEPEAHPAGTELIAQGAPSDALFVLLEGKVDVSREDRGAPAKFVCTLGVGSTFGEIGLLKGVRRTATVRAASDVVVLRIPRDTFMQIVAENDFTSGDLSALMKRTYIAQELAQAIPKLDFSEVGKLARELELVRFAEGAVLIRQGSIADAFYVIASGTVDVLKETGRGRTRVASVGPGAYVGEIGLLLRQPRSATCVAATAVDAIRIERDQFIAMVSGDSSAAHEELATVVGRRLVELARAATPRPEGIR